MVTPARRPATQARRAREQAARKQAILDAARELFIRQGIAATTMDDIAAACELAKGTLYKYFTSKDDVAFELLLEATDELVASLKDTVDPAGTTTAQLEQIARAYCRFFHAQPAAFRYMFIVPHESYPGRVAAPLIERWAASGKAALSLVAGILRQGAEAGEFHIDDPWETAIAFWAAVTGVLVIPSQEVRRPFVGQVDIERLVLTTVRMLIAGLRSASNQRQPRGGGTR